MLLTTTRPLFMDHTGGNSTSCTDISHRCQQIHQLSESSSVQSSFPLLNTRYSQIFISDIHRSSTALKYNILHFKIHVLFPLTILIFYQNMALSVLVTPHTVRATIGDRAFPAGAASVWTVCRRQYVDRHHYQFSAEDWRLNFLSGLAAVLPHERLTVLTDYNVTPHYCYVSLQS